jgi:Ca2+-binding EF-hand superfamily protein
VSISSTNYLDQRLGMMLSQLGNTPSTGAISTNSDGDGDNSYVSSAATIPTGSPNNGLTGPSKAAISDQILALLTKMQSLATSSGTTGSQPTNASTAIAPASTAISPLSQLISAITTNDDGSISQSEMESYIQNLGGTSSEADALYAGLNQGNSGNLTQAQLSSDLQQAQLGNNPQQAQQAGGHHHHHDHGVPSADAVANDFVQAADSNGDGSVSQSEFTNFVTGLGGTTSEATSDFTALDPNNTGSVNAAQISTAIKAFEALGNSATIATNSTSPILTFLDSLAANSTGAGNGTAASTTNITA